MTKSYQIDDGTYTADQISSLFASAPLQAREAVALSMIENLQDHQTLVDLGCLYGGFAAKLAEAYPNSRIIAGDYLDERIEIAKIAYPKHASIYRTLNAYALDLEDQSVDVLTFQAVIEHLEGAAESIKEINRVLKMGGELIISTPTAYYWRDMVQSLKYELIRKRKKLPLSDCIYFAQQEWDRHIYCWTPVTLYTLLKVNGFEYVAHEYCQSAQGRLEKWLLKALPWVSPTMVMKVKKVENASKGLV